MFTTKNIQFQAVGVYVIYSMVYVNSFTKCAENFSYHIIYKNDFNYFLYYACVYPNENKYRNTLFIHEIFPYK